MTLRGTQPLFHDAVWQITLQPRDDLTFCYHKRQIVEPLLYCPSSKVLVIQISSRSDRGVSLPLLFLVIPLPHQNHHNSHTKEVSREAEASDGEAPKTRKKYRRKPSSLESYLSCPALSVAPGRWSGTFCTGVTGAVLLGVSHGPAVLRSLPNEINGLSYSLYTRKQVRRIYVPHLSLPTIGRMLREHNIKK